MLRRGQPQGFQQRFTGRLHRQGGGILRAAQASGAGRNGLAKLTDGQLVVTMTSPTEPGGSGAEKIVERGQFICPHSHATKGNITVKTTLV